jgi:hypothetical protein
VGVIGKAGRQDLVQRGTLAFGKLAVNEDLAETTVRARVDHPPVTDRVAAASAGQRLDRGYRYVSITPG